MGYDHIISNCTERSEVSVNTFMEDANARKIEVLWVTVMMTE